MICALSVLRVMAAYARENDMGCRCAPRRPGRAHRQYGGSCCTQGSCASLFHTTGVAGNAKNGAGSDPAVRGNCCGFGAVRVCAPPAPRPRVAPSQRSVRKGVERRFEEVAGLLANPAGRWAVRHRQPQSRRDPSRLAVSPSRKGPLDPERPPAEGWDGVHIPTLPRGTPSVQGGGLPTICQRC